jgi:2-methylcitrate dehydratase
VEIRLTDGSTIVDEIAVADAHPLGARPFGRADYIHKFRTLAADVLEAAEIERFLDVAERLPSLASDELAGLTITARPGLLDSVHTPRGLF